MTSPSRPVLTDQSALDAALAEWQQILGADRARRDSHELDAASRGTFATASRVRAILEPASRDDVRGCLEIAARHKVPTVVQKPFAPRWEDCVAMVETCRAAGVPLMVHAPKSRAQQSIAGLAQTLSGKGDAVAESPRPASASFFKRLVGR